MTIFFYIMRRTFFAVLGLLLALTTLIIFIDLIESINTVEDYEGGGLFEAILLTLMRTPNLVISMMPFMFLFGSMYAFAQLNRKNEIAVMRSAGMSIWSILAPAITMAGIIGIISFSLIDPLTANLSLRSEQFQDQMRGQKSSFLSELSDGNEQGNIWLNQNMDGVSVVIRAKTYNEKAQRLVDVSVYRRTESGIFIDRWDADFAVLQDQNFILVNATRMTFDIEEKETRLRYAIPTPYKLENLTADIVKPDTISVWKLPSFIELADRAGVESVKYKLRFHALISMPFQLIGMVIIAGCFSFFPIRNGGTARLILTGIGAGFILFITTEIANATAEAQIVPVMIAAWIPISIALLIAFTMLMFNEDG